ncbi:hypothetical protein BY458DRAFT_515352 [Sporodiniella umbellata]|nr:hypothetical protein BY458DRAFT_515352 [Sporodiniella umbellata]
MTTNTVCHEDGDFRGNEATDIISMMQSVSAFTNEETSQEEQDLEDDEMLYWSEDEWEVIKAYFENEEEEEEELRLLQSCTQL